MYQKLFLTTFVRTLSQILSHCLGILQKQKNADIYPFLQRYVNPGANFEEDWVFWGLFDFLVSLSHQTWNHYLEANTTTYKLYENWTFQ